MPMALIGAIGGAVIQGTAASDAANAGAAGAMNAAQLSYNAAQQARNDQMPWLTAGAGALNELNYRMGLGGAGGSQYTMTPAQIREMLIPQFTTEANGFNNAGYDAAMQQWLSGGQANGFPAPNVADYLGRQTIDEAGLKAAIEKKMAEQAAAQAAAQKNPLYGSLLDPFTLKDFKKDPGYNFRLKEGLKGIDALASARGGYNSGATLKALSRFNQDYATGEFQNAWNRDNAQDTNIYNRLAGIANTGQVSANAVGNQSLTSAGQQGAAQMAAGEWRGAGSIGMGSAINNGISNVYGVGQKNGWWSRPGGTSYDDPGPFDGSNFSSYQPPSYGSGGSYADNPFQSSAF